MTILKKEISRLNPEDLASLKDKQHLVIALCQLLFLEFSKLQENGLLGLLGDDETPPEVVTVRMPSLLEVSATPPVPQAKDEPVLHLGIKKIHSALMFILIHDTISEFCARPYILPQRNTFTCLLSHGCCQQQWCHVLYSFSARRAQYILPLAMICCLRGNNIMLQACFLLSCLTNKEPCLLPSELIRTTSKYIMCQVKSSLL